jgi:uncharacterized protein YdcH (DUF465 family)
MIISRKRFEQELAKAREEVLEREREDRRFMELYDRINQLEKRVYALENPPVFSNPQITLTNCEAR